MKKIIALAAFLTACAVMTACAEKNVTEESSSAADSVSVSVSSAADVYGVLMSDGSDYPELIDCIKTQLQAAKDGDFEGFKAAMRPELLIESVLEQSGDSGGERLTDEQMNEVIRETFDDISVTAASFDGELKDVILQTDKEITGSIRMFSVTFDAGGVRYMATGYCKDGVYGAALENETTLSKPAKENAKLAARENAVLIGRAVEDAIEQYGTIPDGSYTFEVGKLMVNDSPKDALEAAKSAVAKLFPFDEEVNEGEMFLLIKGGKVYAQWKSGEGDIGEYPDNGDEFKPTWQAPKT